MSKSAFRFETVLEQAGMNHYVHKSEGIDLSLISSIALLRLHSLQSREDLNKALLGSGIELPLSVNQARGQDPATLCLAPSDWLLYSEYLKVDLLREKLLHAIDPAYSSLLNLSSAYGVFRLSGPIAPWLLSKSSGLDMGKGMAYGQHCSRTRLDQVPAIIHFHQPGSGSGPFVFDVMIERSLAPYCWQLFLENLPHANELEQQYGSFYEQSKLHP